MAHKNKIVPVLFLILFSIMVAILIVSVEEFREGLKEAITLIISGNPEVIEITLRSIYISGTATALAIIWSIPIGLVIGLMSGIFGAGGGMMIVFVLLIIFQYPPHTAIGTATAIMAIIALSGVIGYSIQGHINLEYGIIVSLGAILGGGFGSIFISHKLDENSLMIAMGLIFISVGITTLFLLTFL